MESPFIYNKHVTGKNFIGRKADITILTNLLNLGENVVIYEPAKSGKRSLVEQTLFNMKIATQRFNVADVSFLSARTVADLMIMLGSAIIRAGANSPNDYKSIVSRHLEGTHFVFDDQLYSERDQILSLNWDIDDNDIQAVVSLPYRLSKLSGQRMFVYISEFQNVMLTEDGEKVCHIMEGVFKNRTSEDREAACYIMCGSEVNAMKAIFEHGHFFHRQAEHLKMSTVDSKEIIDHIIRCYLNSGKVIERELLLGVCKLFNNNLWYINHFNSICDSLAKGYIMEPILVDALDTLIAIHEPRFIRIMNDLTTFQVCLLKAVTDGHTKFSSADVIHSYNLNSSANVRRLKDALCKKEILTFNEKDEPSILDPLFEYWVTKYYFAKYFSGTSK